MFACFVEKQAIFTKLTSNAAYMYFESYFVLIRPILLHIAQNV